MAALRASAAPLLASKGVRAVHASPLVRAAVAPAPSTSSSAPRASATPIRKAAVAPRSTGSVKATTPSLLSNSRAKAVSTSSAPNPPATVDDPYDFSDFPAPVDANPEAYSSTSRPSPVGAKKSPPPIDLDGPMPSPPLSHLPTSTSGYSALPSAAPKFSSSGGGTTMASGESGIAGEVSAPAVFHGMSEKPFDKETIEALLKPIHPDDVEVKPDGLLYLPEIKYRRTLNAAFGPGGWGMAPRGETNVGDRIVSREWGLVCLGRLVSIARGEQEYFDKSGIPTATEACKSNALMRCCKDLGIASELWDPRYIREFKDKHCVEVFVEHATKKSKRKLWRKKKGPKFEYPWKETS